MIHPRPTTHISAEPFGLYTIGVRGEQWGRSDAWCPHCGAKLSRYRSLGDIACDPCFRSRARQIDPLKLHPIPYEHKQRPRHFGTVCACGGVKDKRAQQCRSCRYGLEAQ